MDLSIKCELVLTDHLVMIVFHLQNMYQVLLAIAILLNMNKIYVVNR